MLCFKSRPCFGRARQAREAIGKSQKLLPFSEIVGKYGSVTHVFLLLT